MMQFNDYYAWMDQDFNVTVLRPDQRPLAGVYSNQSEQTTYVDLEPPASLVDKALAHALLPLRLYSNRSYGLPTHQQGSDDD